MIFFKRKQTKAKPQNLSYDSRYILIRSPIAIPRSGVGFAVLMVILGILFGPDHDDGVVRTAIHYIAIVFFSVMLLAIALIYALRPELHLTREVLEFKVLLKRTQIAMHAIGRTKVVEVEGRERVELTLRNGAEGGGSSSEAPCKILLPEFRYMSPRTLGYLIDVVKGTRLLRDVGHVSRFDKLPLPRHMPRRFRR